MIIKQNFHERFRSKRIARLAGYLAYYTEDSRIKRIARLTGYSVIKILLHVNFKNGGLLAYYMGYS